MGNVCTQSETQDGSRGVSLSEKRLSEQRRAKKERIAAGKPPVPAGTPRQTPSKTKAKKRSASALAVRSSAPTPPKSPTPETEVPPLPPPAPVRKHKNPLTASTRERVVQWTIDVEPPVQKKRKPSQGKLKGGSTPPTKPAPAVVTPKPEPTLSMAMLQPALNPLGMKPTSTSYSSDEGSSFASRYAEIKGCISNIYSESFMTSIGSDLTSLHSEESLLVFVALCRQYATTPDEFPSALMNDMEDNMATLLCTKDGMLKLAAHHGAMDCYNSALNVVRKMKDDCIVRWEAFPSARGMDEVVPGLWVGSFHPAADIEWLKQHDIHHVVSMVGIEPFAVAPGFRTEDDFAEYPVHYWSVAAHDAEGYPIEEHFNGSYDFIRNACDSGGNVLVHCGAGASRSAAIACNFLCRRFGLSVNDAVHMVSAARRCTKLKETFVYALLSRYSDQ